MLTTLPDVIGVIPTTDSIVGNNPMTLPRLNNSDIRIANWLYKIYLMIMLDNSVKSYSFLFNNSERLHPNEIFAKLCTIADIEKELNAPILNQNFRDSGRLRETLIIDLLDRVLMQDVLIDQRNKKIERFANIVYFENGYCPSCKELKTGYFHRPSEDDTIIEQCLKHHLRSVEDKFTNDPSFQEALQDLKRTIVTKQRLLLTNIELSRWQISRQNRRNCNLPQSQRNASKASGTVIRMKQREVDWTDVQGVLDVCKQFNKI